MCRMLFKMRTKSHFTKTKLKVLLFHQTAGKLTECQTSYMLFSQTSSLPHIRVINSTEKTFLENGRWLDRMIAGASGLWLPIGARGDISTALFNMTNNKAFRRWKHLWLNLCSIRANRVIKITASNSRVSLDIRVRVFFPRVARRYYQRHKTK